MSVLVTGAGGNVGSAVLSALRSRGVAATAFDRSSQSIEDALQGVKRLFLACGNVPGQLEFELQAIDAADAAGVQRVVKLSAIGAEIGSPLVFWDWHGRIEAHLAASGLEAVVLRPATYTTSIPPMITDGRLFAPAGDARVALVDPRDVGAAAAAALVDDTVEVGTYVLTGPRGLSFAEIAEAFGAEYVDVPPEAAREGMLQSGLPEFVADFLIRLFGEIRAGRVAEPTMGLRELIGRDALEKARFT